MIKITQQIKSAKKLLKANGRKLSGWRFIKRCGINDAYPKGNKWVSICLSVVEEQIEEGKLFRAWVNGLDEIVIEEII